MEVNNELDSFELLHLAVIDNIVQAMIRSNYIDKHVNDDIIGIPKNDWTFLDHELERFIYYISS